MRAFERFIKLVAPVIMFLNTPGPVIAGIWLLFLGEWKLVLISFLATALLAPKLIGLALVPQVAIAGPALYFAKRHNRIRTYFFLFLSHLYAAALMVGWSVMVLDYFTPATGAVRAANSAAPYLLWAYGVATAPWTYLTLHDASENASPAQFLCFSLQLGYIAAALATYVLGANLVFSAVLIAGAILLGLCIVVPLAGHQLLLEGAYQSLGETVDRLTRK